MTNPWVLLKVMNRYHAQVMPARMVMNPNTQVRPVVQKMAILRWRKGVASSRFSLACDQEAMKI